MMYACIGEHLKHSFSKEIHRLLGNDGYTLRELAEDELDAFMKSADFQGINVTIPYKEAVIPYLNELDGASREIGAVNTVINKNGKLYGYNTDFFGMTALFRYAGIDPCQKKAAILGSGGTAKTAKAVLKSLGAGQIISVSRSAKNGAVSYSELYEKHSDTEILINTTPVGMFPNIHQSPVNLSRFEKLYGVIDAVYNPLRTQLVTESKKLGIRAEGGLYMLVAQAVRASELFLDTLYPKNTLENIFEKIKSEKENIVLIGMPACGKSTHGALLAAATGRKFIDTDAIIVEKIGMPINNFFKIYGEDKFREIESEVIKELSPRSSLIIATGGGAVLRDENVGLLKMNGKLVFLDRNLNELRPTSSRPLSSDRAALIARYNERYPRYSSVADIKITVTGEKSKVSEKIKSELKLI